MTEVLVMEQAPVMVEPVPVPPYPMVDRFPAPDSNPEAGYDGIVIQPQTQGEYLGNVAMTEVATERQPSEAPLGDDFQAWQQELGGGDAELAERREDRRQALIGLEHDNSFPDDGLRYQAANIMAATGMPIGNVRKLRYEANERGSEDVLASFGVGFLNRGEYTVYALLGRVVPEKGVGTHLHELSHASSPLRRENTHLYGNEDGRMEAERRVVAIAEQSRITGVHLNGYHKFLLDKLSTNDIDLQTYYEETWAITSEMAATKRLELTRVEADQHNQVREMQRNGQVSPDYQPVNLVSHEARGGQTTVDGVDGLLIQLIDGVEDYQGLIAHSGRLKAEFYPHGSRSLAVANGRHLRQFGYPLIERQEEEELSDAERRRRGLHVGGMVVAVAA